MKISKNKMSDEMNKLVLQRIKGINENDRDRQIAIQIDQQTFLVAIYSTCWLN